MGNWLLAVLAWIAMLLLPVFASGQGCSGAVPNDVCEQATSSARINNVPDKTALSPASQKVASAIREAVDGILAYAPNAESRGLDALSTAVARVNVAGEIHVYVILTDLRTEYLAQLEATGLRVEQTLPDFRLIQGWVPANLVDLIAGFDFVAEVRPPGYAVPNVGAQLTAGDSILRADVARATFGATGAGVTVGVISTGVDHLAQSVATGDLPAGVQVLKNFVGDEGTAMLEIVHDLAPGAALAFYGPTTSADMVIGINALAAAGARVVVDDLTFFDEPKFQDGMIAQTARNFATGGKVYVTSAGNHAQRHYRATYNRLAGQNFPNASYPAVHNYKPNPDIDIGNTFTLPANCNITVVLQWNNPNGASSDDFDLFLRRSSDSAPLAQSTNPQTGTQDALERLTYANTTGVATTVFIAVAEFRLVSPASSLILDYFIYPNCTIPSPGFQYFMSADSVIGHHAVNEVLSVAALNASSQAEPYSSRGPASISFPTQETRSVPNMSAIDCVTTEVGVLGFFVNGNPFCGTSAAAPHVAAIAALLIQLNPALTSQALRNALTGTAIDLGSAGFDFTFGFGRVDAVSGAAAAAPSFSLTVTRTGTGQGTVTASPVGINCGTTCAASLTSNTTVTLTAVSATGSVFAGWSGCDSVAGTQCTVVATATRTVTATFNRLSPEESFVTRFYGNVLDRDPESAGLASWVAFLLSNCNAQGFDAIARGFFDSLEFRTVKPHSLDGLVTLLYQTFLGREPDPSGLAGWADLIRQARLTIALQGFIPSREFQSLLPDRTNRAVVTTVVTRLYQHVLGREPEAPGLQGWVDFIVATGNLEQAATGFLASQELEGKALTFRDYVTILYRTFLNRDPDPAGVDAWEGILRTILLQVIDQGFVPSQEFQSLVPLVCG